MDIKQIRQLIRNGGMVVLLEEGQTPLMVSELPESEAPAQEVPISSRWPKAVRSRLPETIEDLRPKGSGQDQILERLNKEILALKAQIEQEESVVQE